jgi:glucose dehydrogenase
MEMKKLCAVAVLASVTMAGAQNPASQMIEWPHYGSQQAHTKYSTAADITPANVGRLAPAWEWRTGEQALPDDTRPGSF